MVTYKAKRLGKKVLPINEAYTTQICARCGVIKKRVISERVIECSNCNYRIDRDLASAINILAKFYIEKDSFDNLLHEPSVNEESFFQKWNGFLRQTVEGKTKVSLSSYWLRFGGFVGSLVLYGRVVHGNSFMISRNSLDGYATNVSVCIAPEPAITSIDFRAESLFGPSEIATKSYRPNV